MRTKIKAKARTIAAISSGKKTFTLKSKGKQSQLGAARPKHAKVSVVVQEESKYWTPSTYNSSFINDSFHAFAFKSFFNKLRSKRSTCVPALGLFPPVHSAKSDDTNKCKETALAAFGKDVIAGSLSGIAITAVGHPLDTVKTLMQTQTSSKYSTISSCARTIFQQGGLPGFYRGASSPLAMYILYSSVYYSSYIQARRFLGIGDRTQKAPAHLILAASTLTGICTTFVRAPMDLMKTQAQISSLASNSGQAQGALAAGFELIKTKGFLSLFKGFGPTLARQVVGASAWFFPYEMLKPMCGSGAGGVFLAGGLASWVYWTMVYPIDVIKTRVQSPGSTSSSSWNCLKNLLRVEGARGLFRGYVPCMLRAFPANAAGIVAYEQGRLLINGLIDE